MKAAFEDFLKLDLRVGKVVEIEDPPESKKLFKLTVDFGEELGKKTIFAGLKGYYSKEELLGKKFIFVYNLEPKKIMGEFSEGMLLAADIKGEPVLLPVDPSIPEGTKVR